MHAAASIETSASVFWNQDRIRFRRRTGPRGNESAGLDDSIERAAIDHQIFHDRKALHPKRLDHDRLAIAKFAHVKLAGCAGMIRSVRFAVHGQRTSSANSFATIGIERDRFFAAKQAGARSRCRAFRATTLAAECPARRNRRACRATVDLSDARLSSLKFICSSFALDEPFRNEAVRDASFGGVTVPLLLEIPRQRQTRNFHRRAMLRRPAFDVPRENAHRMIRRG